MTLFLGVIGLFLFGMGTLLVLALFRWLVLIGLSILIAIGGVSLAIGAFVFFALFEFFGANYGPFILAISISAGLMAAISLALGIATELGIRQCNFFKESHCVR